MTALRASLEQNIGSYIDNDLPAGGALAEHGETLTFAAIELPMAQTNPPLAKNPTYWLTASNEVLSSWGPPFARLNASTNGFKPRFGYSVKFVAMQDLLKSGMNSSDDDQEKVSH
jgi:hypothetical protein